MNSIYREEQREELNAVYEEQEAQRRKIREEEAYIRRQDIAIARHQWQKEREASYAEYQELKAKRKEARRLYYENRVKERTALRATRVQLRRSKIDRERFTRRSNRAFIKGFNSRQSTGQYIGRQIGLFIYRLLTSRMKPLLFRSPAEAGLPPSMKQNRRGIANIETLTPTERTDFQVALKEAMINRSDEPIIAAGFAPALAEWYMLPYQGSPCASSRDGVRLDPFSLAAVQGEDVSAVFRRHFVVGETLQDDTTRTGILQAFRLGLLAARKPPEDTWVGNVQMSNETNLQPSTEMGATRLSIDTPYWPRSMITHATRESRSLRDTASIMGVPESGDAIEGCGVYLSSIGRAHNLREAPDNYYLRKAARDYTVWRWRLGRSSQAARGLHTLLDVNNEGDPGWP